MDLKFLIEQRAEKVEEMKKMLEKAKIEKRAMTEDELKAFDEVKRSVENLDDTIQAAEDARKSELDAEGSDAAPEDSSEGETREVRAFENYLRSKCGLAIETRSGEQNFTMGNNGAIIPTTIANRIIRTVKDMCPIFAKSTMFSVKGTLKIPVYGLANTTHDITVGYQTEFTDITADAGKFTSVDLSGFLAGALTLLGKSVITNSEIDITNFVINEMASKIASFLEHELLLGGGTTAATGALSTTNTMNAGSTSAITADNLIDLQAKVKNVYQANACWTMAPATFTAIRKLKDSTGQYLLQNNFSQDFPYSILGKPVYISDNMPAIGSTNKAVLYGDYSGLAVNMRQNIEVQVLNEKYATQHAVGIVSWFEFDSNVMDAQKLATLVMSV